MECNKRTQNDMPGKKQYRANNTYPEWPDSVLRLMLQNVNSLLSVYTLNQKLRLTFFLYPIGIIYRLVVSTSCQSKVVMQDSSAYQSEK